MQPGKPRQAHTLIELLVASTLLIVLMFTIVKALVACNDYLRNAETKTEAQTQALAACVWLSRSLSESSYTATCTTVAPTTSISFPSPRDPALGDVAWSGTQGGAIVWRQIKFCYLETASQRLIVKGFPLTYAGSVPTVVWAGFPPFPAGVVDLTMGPQPLTAAVMGSTAAPERVIAKNIRQFNIDIYGPTDPVQSKVNSASMVVEAFAPYYGLNYAIRVVSAVRLQNSQN